jgi:peptidoglycan hydrolase CwlO-like protein
MEKSELELSHKMAELQTAQTRLQTADEQISDLRKHLQVLKEANSAKEQQLTLFQGDVSINLDDIDNIIS